MQLVWWSFVLVFGPLPGLDEDNKEKGNTVKPTKLPWKLWC
jgi:hypothetical protein